MDRSPDSLMTRRSPIAGVVLLYKNSNDRKAPKAS
jgi:hypothetical protein